jgi:hypothetical protein
MKLLTKEIIAKLPAIGSTDGKPHDQRKVICKFFHPCSNWAWYLLEGSQTESGDWELFGLVRGFESELGYFNLSELQSVKVRGLGIERDLYFGDHTLAEVEEGRV